ATLEKSERTELDAIEHQITEGVQAIESDRLDEAERCFRQVLEKSPEHREALHYLETIQKKRAGKTGAPGQAASGMHEDLLGGGDLLMDLPAGGTPGEVHQE